MNSKYAFQGLKENMARALSKDVGISTKTSIEVANVLRGRTTENAKSFLERVLKGTQSVPMKRFVDGVGHRKGSKIGAGRFPQKTSIEFVNIINAVEANAQSKGLSSNLKIIHLVAQKGNNQFRGGRHSRRDFKRTHLEIVVEEQEAQKKTRKETAKKTVVAETKKVPEKTSMVEEKKSDVKKENAPKIEKVVEKKPEVVKEEKTVIEKKPVVKKETVEVKEEPKKEIKSEPKEEIKIEQKPEEVKEEKSSSSSKSRDANLVACGQEHEMVTILKVHEKENNKENREIMTEICKEFKSKDELRPHNRDSFYKYLETSEKFQNISTKEKTKDTSESNKEKEITEEKND